MPKKKIKKTKPKTEKLSLMPPKKLTTDLTVLEKAFDGDKKMVLFFLAWLKHNRNATLAYQELHPNVTKESAAVMGSMKLRNIKVEMILDSYGLGIDTYIQKIKEGLDASAIEYKTITIGKGKKKETIYKEITRPDHATQKSYHETLGKLLGLEVKKDEGATIAVQVNNLISEKKNTYGI